VRPATAASDKSDCQPASPRHVCISGIAALIRHRLTLSLATAAAAVALALPAGAVAATCAPPGNSGVNQYVEVVPGVGCNHPTSGPGSGNGGHHTGGTLPSSTSRQLAASGGAGKAVQQLVSSSGTGSGTSTSTGKAAGHPKRGHGSSGGSPSVGRQINASGRSPLSALLHPILTGAGADGLGLILPVGLACILAFMVLVALLRRRRLTS
jgi:hypothetical protein